MDASIERPAIGTRERDAARGSDLPAAEQPVHATIRAGVASIGTPERLKAFIVNYADDLVICCRGSAEEALAAMRQMMTS